ncbi:MAG TPA: S-adenosylmethionine decarboxylase [Gemmatimonadales bacterium]|nr:S-adenosylmethionine decarboxylase [Gemmatimonadales bacterium]
MASYSQHISELTNLSPARLAEEATLAAVTIAAASAVGLIAYGTPTVKSGPRGTSVALLAHGGHLVLHAVPDEGRCLVDLVTPGPADPVKALEILVRRLSS